MKCFIYFFTDEEETDAEALLGGPWFAFFAYLFFVFLVDYFLYHGLCLYMFIIIFLVLLFFCKIATI